VVTTLLYFRSCCTQPNQ